MLSVHTDIVRKRASRRIQEKFEKLVLEKFDRMHMESVSEYPNITMDFIEAHPEIPWNWESICENPNLNFSFVKRNLEKFTTSQDFNLISANPGITLKDMDEYFPWSWGGVLRNPNLTMKFVIQHQKRNLELFWYWGTISRNPGITVQDVLNNPELPWDVNNLVHNPNITVDLYEKLLKPMGASQLANSINCTLNDVVSLDLPLNYLNREVPLWFIAKNIDKITNLTLISENMNLTLEFVLQHSHRDWNWRALSRVLSPDEIDSHPELPWHWRSVYANPRLTIPFIRKHSKRFISCAFPLEDLDLDLDLWSWRELFHLKIEVF